jgi:HD-GYP domain-containing protein (c-di-GMP phosphodiesterase class II)
MTARTRSIHRSLIVRLAFAAVFLAGILGATAFLNERRQLSERVAERSRLAVELFKAEVRRLVERGVGSASDLPVREALENLARVLPPSEMGGFAFVTIHDPARQELARLMNPDHPEAARIAAALEKRGLRFPEKGVEFGNMLGVADTPDVPVALPIANPRGETIGFVNGVFVLSPAAAAELGRAAPQAAAFAVVLVFVTVLLIYPVIRRLIARLGELTVRLLDANIDTIKALGSAVAKRDSDTDAHNYRVTIYSVRMAEALGLEARAIRSLIKGAFLHDVGKIGIRDPILLKPGRLDKDEFAIMQGHVQHGLDIVGRATWLADAGVVVGYHHEKYDGSGYPAQLRGNDIPIAARIFAVADVFDALTSERPYKKPFTLEESLKIVQESAGSHFDPEVVAVFGKLAPALYASFANREDEPRRELAEIATRYFQGDLGEILDEATAPASG